MSGTVFAFVKTSVLKRKQFGLYSYLKYMLGESVMRKLFSRLRREEEGASLVEYGLLVGLIAVACVVAIGVLGTTIAGYFAAINAAL